jgi:hypothetical protein
LGKGGIVVKDFQINYPTNATLESIVEIAPRSQPLM